MVSMTVLNIEQKEKIENESTEYLAKRSQRSRITLGKNIAPVESFYAIVDELTPSKAITSESKANI